MAEDLGRYELGEKLAQGGMAAVHRAIQHGPSGFERTCAVKVLLPEIADDPELIDLLLDEARIAAQLSHPNICQILELGNHRGRYFIAMEYLEGHTAAELFQRGIALGRPLPSALAGFIALGVAEALTHAHEKLDAEGKPLQIIHRDVSPQNVFLTTDGHIKLLDFGIARAANRIAKTMPGILVGKCAYMSPEQVRGEELTQASDLFSLSTVLHELLTGRRLFEGATNQAIMRSVLDTSIPAVAGPAPLAELGELAMKGLARTTAQRLGSARDMARLLERALRPHAADSSMLAAELSVLFSSASEAEVSSFHAAPATREVGSPRRGRGLTAGLAACALLAALGVYALQHRRHETVADQPRIATVQAEGREPSVPPAPLPAAPPMPAPSLAVATVERDPATSPVTPVRIPRTRAPTAPKHRASRAAAAGSTPPARPPGRLTLDTSPWTEVRLGSRKLGMTPLVEVEMPAGHQRLRVVNLEAHIDKTIDADIASNQTTTLSVHW